MMSVLTPSPPQVTIPSDQGSSPGPIPTDPTVIAAPIARCPVTTFAHRASGSFLNTISNQFTPSPSSSPVPAADNDTSSLNSLKDGQSSDDGNDFDMPDIQDAEERPECGAGGEGHMEVDSETVPQIEVELRSTLHKVSYLLTWNQ